MLLTCLFVAATLLANAQINKGTILLGGNIGFSTNKAKDTTLENNSVSIFPAIGVAIKQNLIAGISLGYGHYKNDLTAGSYSQSENKSYGATIFLRKYVPLGKGFYLFGETGLNYQSSSYTYTYKDPSSPPQESRSKNQNININLYPGLSYAVSKRFQLEIGLPQLANLGYSKSTNITNDVIDTEASGINFNASASSFSNISLGFRFFFSK